MPDHVMLRVPADTAHVGVVRAAATALAARLDFTIDRLTDLHIAIDEVCSRILATTDNSTTLLEVRFEAEAGNLRVRIKGDCRAKDVDKFLNSWSRMILDSVTDALSIQSMDGIAEVTFDVLKEAAP